MAQLVEQSVTSGRSGTSQSGGNAQGGDVARLTVFLHSLAFVLGFATIFTLLGVVAGLVGVTISDWLQKIGAILLFILALTTLGVFRWAVQKIGSTTNPVLGVLVSIMNFFNNLLYSEKRVVEVHSVNKNWGYLSSFIIGLSFGAGWTPCVGPILGSIWFLAGSSDTVVQATVLMAIYSLGLGIPFLIVGAAFSSMSVWLRKLNRYMNVIGIVSGILLIFIAALLWTGSLASLAGYFPGLNEMAYALEESAAGAVGGDIIGSNLLGAAPIALIAGILSFVSPCVLPLVPGYIGYLSGASLNN